MNAQPPVPSSGRTSGEGAVPTPLTFVEAAASQRSQNPMMQALGRVWRMRAGRFGVVVVGLLVFIAIAAPLLAPHDPSEQFRGDELKAPGSEYLLGTDQLGRDLLSRVIYASRASLIAGVLAVSFGAVVGVSTGLLAGYNGGWVDTVIMRAYDGLLTFPTILLAIAIVTVTGPGLVNVAIAIGIAQVPVDARLTRSIVLSQRERDYVLAARSLGVSGSRIVVAHILPNTLPLLLVRFALAMGFAVLVEGSLSFLGLGTQPPTPSWGGMLNDSRAFLRTAPWYGLYPGLALATLLIGLNFLADALRDALDPRRIHIAR
jgi:peptide/nickel transport system permease protein